MNYVLSLVHGKSGIFFSDGVQIDNVSIIVLSSFMILVAETTTYSKDVETKLLELEFNNNVLSHGTGTAFSIAMKLLARKANTSASLSKGIDCQLAHG